MKRTVKIILILAVSFCVVYFLPELFANDTLVIETAKGSLKDQKIDDDTTALIIAVLTAIVNLIVHLFSNKKKKK